MSKSFVLSTGMKEAFPEVRLFHLGAPLYHVTRGPVCFPAVRSTRPRDSTEAVRRWTEATAPTRRSAKYAGMSTRSPVTQMLTKKKRI